MPKKTKRISQKKIAEALGVSQSLVSFVLNGRKEGIATKSYNAIWNFALENGYTPKGMKVSPITNNANSRNQVKAVGYILRSPLKLANKSNFFSHITQGLHEYLKEHKCNLIFLGSEDDLEDTDLSQISWNEDFFQGIVIMGEVKPAFLQKVRSQGKPIVYLCARAHGMCHSVNSNEFQAAEQLVEHLLKLGHERFAFLGTSSSRSLNKERYNATLSALQAHGLHLDEECPITGVESDRKEGMEFAKGLLEKESSAPTAWICFNGPIARGAISIISNASTLIQDKVSIVAFDNTRICTDESPRITSAATIPEELGKEAGRIILENKANSNIFSDRVLASKFSLRDS